MALQTREVGAAHHEHPGAQPSLNPTLYTRYCAAPQPLQPVGEPRYLRALLLAAWIGRLGRMQSNRATR